MKPDELRRIFDPQVRLQQHEQWKAEQRVPSGPEPEMVESKPEMVVAPAQHRSLIALLERSRG